MPSSKPQAVATAFLLVAAAFTGAVQFTTTAAATQESASFETVDGTVRVHAVGNATISGGSTLEEGTDVTLRVRSTAEGDAFVKNPEITIQEDGAFSATLNFSHYDVGTNFTVSVRNGAEAIGTADGRVVPQDVRVEPTATGTPTTASATSTNDSTNGTVPGFTLASGVAACCAVALLVSRRS